MVHPLTPRDNNWEFLKGVWLLDMNETEGFQEDDYCVYKVCYRAKVAIGLHNAFTWKQFSLAVISHLYGELWGDEIHPLMPDVTKTETMR